MKGILIVFIYIVMGFVFVLLAPLELPFPITWYHSDEGFILYKSYLVSIGKTPYLDFDPFWPPLVYYFNGFLFRVFGVRVLVAKYGLAGVGLLSAICMFAVAKKIMPAWVALLCSISFIFCGPLVLNVPYSSWYTVPVGLAGLYAVFIAIERESLDFVLLAGIAAGLAFSFKQSIGVFVGASFAVMGLFWKERGKENPSTTSLSSRAVGLIIILSMCVGLPLAYVSKRTVGNLLFFTPPALVAGALVLWFQERSASRNRPLLAFQTLKSLIFYELALSAGFAIAIASWFGYLAAKVGFLTILRRILLIGESWRLSDMLVPLPHVNAPALLFPISLIVLSGFGYMVLHRRRDRAGLLLWGSVLALYLLLISYWMLGGFVWRYFLSTNWDTDVFMFTPAVVVAWFTIHLLLRDRSGKLSREDLFALCLFIFSALLLQQTYPFADLNHFTFGFAPWMILCFFLVYRLTLGIEKNTPDSSIGLAVVRLLCVASLAIFLAGRAIGTVRLLVRAEQDAWGWSLRKRAVAPLNVEGSEIVFDADYSRMFGEVAQYLTVNTLPTDTITGLPSLAIFNVLTERQTPTKFVYLWPGYYSDEEVLSVAEDIRRGKPKYVVISDVPSSPGDVFSYRYYAEEYPEIASVVEEAYEPEKIIGCFTLMRRKVEPNDG